eukprot:1729924-Pleurochrysis_carterae.AAC.1
MQTVTSRLQWRVRIRAWVQLVSLSHAPAAEQAAAPPPPPPPAARARRRPAPRPRDSGCRPWRAHATRRRR